MLLRLSSRVGVTRAMFAARPMAAASAIHAAGVRRYATPNPSEAFLNGTSANYVEAMHEAWRANPASVHKSWQVVFEKGGSGYVSPPGLTSVAPSAAPSSSSSSSSALSSAAVEDVLNVNFLMRAFQVSGHREATLDPLGISTADLDGSTPPEIAPEYYGFTEADLARTFPLNGTQSKAFGGRTSATLKEIVDNYKSIYCGNIGFEYMHIQDRNECNWLRNFIERPAPTLTADEKKWILKQLVMGEGFEKMIQKKYGSEKRFGVDGCEVMIPALNRMIEKGAEHGAEMFVFGIAHRGRLNTLHNVLQKKMEMIFCEFQSTLRNDQGSGDVKYHLGMESDIVTSKGHSVHLSMLANPSHLEAVNPVVEGKVRAEQVYKGDKDGKRVVPVLIHGDAAFAGQGVVYETLGFSALPAYSTGGTVHVVVNNQIGFTTDPRSSRSTPYCTDIAKMVSAPIFHVNADDPEAVQRCMDIAIAWRQEFGRDVVVDLVCYRRFGHNESDQPKFTQPLMYQKIEQHPSALTQYAEKLVASGVVTKAEADGYVAEYEQGLSAAFEAAKTFKRDMSEFLPSYWKDFRRHVKNANIQNTGVALDTLRSIGEIVSTVPEGFHLHPALKRTFKNRLQSFEKDELDWAMGEALAFGSLLLEGNHVRLSGQDVERGTFSQRHSVIHDQERDGVTYTPLKNLSHLNSKAGEYSVSNSHLSEFAVLGFELGYSQTNPYALVMWEAQFGDFANTAQCIIDQFITSGEAKWGTPTGLVMLLPHGYEGQGPEHSSARLERFLQMCNDDESVYPEMNHVARTQIENCNIQVVMPTTPANIFHILRRQLHREFRKPLVVMEPKSLLRHPRAVSKLEEMGPGTRFVRFIPETDKAIFDGQNNNDKVRRLILCSGKVYYDLVEERERLGLTDVAVARVEQLSPFPFDFVHKHADNFPNAQIVWAQEEPKNMGSWSYVGPRITTALSKSDSHKGAPISYVGRAASASTATGDKYAHKDELHDLLHAAFQ